MMTAFPFILGVSPLLFATGAGAASRTSVGFVVFGGMLAATVIGVFFIPVLYMLYQDMPLIAFRTRQVLILNSPKPRPQPERLNE
jgi:hydrophobic/amphiphilic exporter-1 (mainly G- bacteria), HAE1 family